MGQCLDMWLCVVVCIRVSHSHAKQLATSEEAWPVPCMFQRVALHVSRSTTSQNPNHTDKGMCTSIHTQTHRDLAQGTLGMGIHVVCPRGPDVFISS